MIYFYKVISLRSGRVFDHQSTDVDEFASYRDFIANLEALNALYAGEYRYEETFPE